MYKMYGIADFLIIPLSFVPILVLLCLLLQTAEILFAISSIKAR